MKKIESAKFQSFLLIMDNAMKKNPLQKIVETKSNIELHFP